MTRTDPKYRQRPCTFCTVLTRLEFEQVGPRGARSWVPCCVECGEQPARRKKP